MVWSIRSVNAGHEQQWRGLYRGYREFYELPEDEAKVDAVWNWINDPGHEVQGLIAEDERGHVGGLANIRRFARPTSASSGLYLDDLFTSPELRGQGIAGALLEHLKQLARDEGLTVVRWITAESNTQARVLYDAKATATPWVTYDMGV